MKAKCIVSLFSAFVFSLGWVRAWADPPPQFPTGCELSQRSLTLPQAIEGLTGDGVNNLYTGGTGNAPCPIWQINLHTFAVDGGRKRTPAPVGGPAPSQASLSMPLGNLYQADGTAGRIYKLRDTKCEQSPEPHRFMLPAFPGTNGLAWIVTVISGPEMGLRGLGRVWKITGAGGKLQWTQSDCEVRRSLSDPADAQWHGSRGRHKHNTYR